MKYIIFDLDGTLSRTDRFMIPSIELAMKKLSIPLYSEEVIRSTIGEPVEVTNHKLFGKENCEEADIFWGLVSKYYRTAFGDSVEQYKGVGEMLDRLHERGYKTAVCSNADQEYIEEVLGKLSLREKIDKIRPIISAKGKVESLKRFLMDENPEFALLVGDRCYDLEAARANSIFFVGCCYGIGNKEELKDSDYTINEPLELLSVLGEIEKRKF
ncbi:MAG: HAD family hydrolase [Lachnospiraceae bacterium]|nr:HAD family hydrolase [Lachnospiraceae bacterium]